jgi:hypothetical protein
MGENHSFSSEFYHSTHLNVEFSMGRMQWETTESNWAWGQTGQPRSVAGQPHFAPNNSEFRPKFPYKSLNSLLLLILEIWKE